MIRGEYVLNLDGEDIVLPNSFTVYGVGLLMKAAFWQQPIPLKMGLCAVNPQDFMQLASIQEPNAINGYARQDVPMNQTNWPVLSSINGETMVESREVTFPLTGATSNAVNRLFLTDGIGVISVSSAFEEGLGFKSTPYSQKYRLYIR